jgi:hypothetical protein
VFRNEAGIGIRGFVSSLLPRRPPEGGTVCRESGVDRLSQLLPSAIVREETVEFSVRLSDLHPVSRMWKESSDQHRRGCDWPGGRQGWKGAVGR